MLNTDVYAILLLISVLLIFYSYVVFPAILAWFTGKKELSSGKINSDIPFVSIIISAYNEEGIIRTKLDSIVNAGYPSDRFEVLVGSDASTDRTAEIVREYSIKTPSIRVYEFPTRRGKPGVMNELVSLSKGAILILTDANVLFGKGVIHNLTRHFNDLKIGLVGANILNVGMKDDGISRQEKSYIERENMIKYNEGVLWGCMMGPFGGCYALRRKLYVTIPPAFLVDDFYVSMKVIEQKYFCINDLEALCYEDVSNDIRQEYRRKSRISAGNFQNLSTFRNFLLRPFSPAGFCFISHKFLRWMTPFLIIVSVVALAVLSTTSRIYLCLFIGELILLLSPFIDALAARAGVHFRFLRFISYFSYMNLALLRGFFKYVGGIDSGVWTPTKRSAHS